ncbi:hypothetical protein [Clostridium ljungdahlii]|uniref:Uncharacterized protein n=1 Tax=Clostridium ljungdahlii TaxID=1538 RepID=A0A166RAY6_9CLOT|nr:hypothetical protein [Clostridium ljungdahlii]OAA90657.1 hypothetical protein WY13_01561 [Clostridium ljungdahlii]
MICIYDKKTTKGNFDNNSHRSYGELKQQHIVPASSHTLLSEAVAKTPTGLV